MYELDDDKNDHIVKQGSSEYKLFESIIKHSCFDGVRETKESTFDDMDLEDELNEVEMIYGLESKKNENEKASNLFVSRLFKNDQYDYILLLLKYHTKHKQIFVNVLQDDKLLMKILTRNHTMSKIDKMLFKLLLVQIPDKIGLSYVNFDATTLAEAAILCTNQGFTQELKIIQNVSTMKG